MKQATKSSYIKFFNDAINNNRSLKAQCTISGKNINTVYMTCLLYTSPSPRDRG